MDGVLFCKAKDHCLYTPKSEIKMNWFDNLEYENEPMPKECKLYSYQYKFLDEFMKQIK